MSSTPAPEAQPSAAPNYYVVKSEPKGLSVTGMILGLVGIVFGFSLLVPAGGLVFGIIGLRKEPAGRGFALTGIITGGVVLAGWIIGYIFLILFSIGVLGAAATSSGYSS